jgi:hypothetical protein
MRNGARSGVWSKIIVLACSFQFVKDQRPHIRVCVLLVKMGDGSMRSTYENVSITDLPIRNPFHVFQVEFSCADEIAVNTRRRCRYCRRHLDPVLSLVNTFMNMLQSFRTMQHNLEEWYLV